MPEIKEYSNQANLKAVLDPSNPIRAGAAQLSAAKVNQDMWGSLGETAQALGKEWETHRARQEISHGFKTEAELNDNLSTAWNNYLKNADPNDPTTADRFRKEELEPILDSFATSFQTGQGKQWSEARVAALRAHYFEKTISDQSRLAGVAAVSNLTETQNLIQAGLQKDPTNLPMALGTLDSMVEATLAANPNWDAAQIASFRGQLLPKMRQDAVMAAGVSMARTNPDDFARRLAEGWGGKDIDAGQREQLFGMAQSIKKADEADARAAEARAKTEVKAAGNRFLTEIYTSGYNEETGVWTVPPGAQKAIVAKMHENPEMFDPGETHALLNAMAQGTQDELEGKNRRSDPNTYSALTKKIGHGLTKTEVDQAYADKRLSKEDYTFLRTSGEGSDGSSDDAKIPGWTRLNSQIDDFIRGHKSSITKSNPMAMEIYPLQDQRAYEFENQLRRSIIGAIKGGLTADQAAERYLNPQSKDYFGKLVQFYQLTPDQLDQEAMRDSNVGSLPPVDLRAIGRAGGAAPAGQSVPAAPRKPGESAAQYLARTGG